VTAGPRTRVATIVLLALAAGAAPAIAQTQIGRTVHNLTTSGPGNIRVSEIAGMCVFCHTPHDARPTRALWNRDLPGTTYTVYQSSTLEAQLNQPTGSSRLCLSCHDGTLAMGVVRRASTGARFQLGPLTGRTVSGKDLSHDHPISFVYDAALAARRGQLANPANLPRAVRLDETRQLQCTTCHDAHEDRNPKFLRIDNRFGALCTACHTMRNWSASTHAVSAATWKGSGPSPWSGLAASNVAENACQNCHRSHGAGHAERLLARSDESGNCTVCHGGSMTSKNLEQEILKPFRHPVDRNQWLHDPKEEPALMPDHVTCVDCHNPHATMSLVAATPAVPGRLRGVRGVTASGGRINEVNFEYEVCLKCHGVKEPTTQGLVRQDTTRNIRLKISASSVSYHPLATPGRNSTISGLEPAYTASSVIQCTDCHNNDAWTSAGTRPRGPHGSIYEGILEREFRADDPSSESFARYALCYKCHSRTTLLSGSGSTRFPHSRHVVQHSASCAACHDSHGSRQNAHLINFMVRTKTGSPVVSPARSGRLEYVSNPTGGGSCYLTCHGANHDPRTY
jgi:predicted CXXCH cytochrome family protein